MKNTYGIYARHVRDLEIANVRMNFEKPEMRPAIVCVDGDEVEIDNVKAQLGEGVSGAKFDGVKGLAVRNSPMMESERK